MTLSRRCGIFAALALLWDSRRPVEAQYCRISSAWTIRGCLPANLELRFPILRPFGVRSGMYGPLPVGAAVFADIGIAVAQIDWARPFERPGGGWVWEFNFIQGF